MVKKSGRGSGEGLVARDGREDGGAVVERLSATNWDPRRFLSSLMSSPVRKTSTGPM